MPALISPPSTLPSDRLMCNGSAPDMRQRGRGMLDSYAAHQADFAGLNPQFAGDSFLTAARAALQTADDARAFDVRVAARDLAYQQEDAALNAAYRLLKPLYYAVGQAWPGPSTKTWLKSFGHGLYEPARRSAAKLLELLSQALPAAAAPANATALAGKGWTQSQYATLADARTKLQEAHEQVLRQIGISGEEATAYYRAQNTFYWFLQQLNDAADVLYADDAAREKQYRLGVGASDRLQFTLKPGQTKAVRHEPLGPDRVLRCSVQAAPPDPKDPDARLWLDFLPVEGADVERRVALLPTEKYYPQKVKVSELGEPGPLLAIENHTAADAVVTITVGE